MPTTPLPVLPDIYRVTLNWRDNISGQKAANVLHFRGAGLTPTNVYTQLDASITRGLWFAVISTAHVETVDVLKLDGVSPTYTNATGSPAKWAGNSGGDLLPQVAAIVKHKTDYRGRANRGRTFFGLVGETAVTAGAIVTALMADAQTAWSTFLVAAAAAGISPVVASYDRLHAGAGAHWHYITSYSVEANTGTMRRRQQRNRR